MLAIAQATFPVRPKNKPALQQTRPVCSIEVCEQNRIRIAGRARLCTVSVTPRGLIGKIPDQSTSLTMLSLGIADVDVMTSLTYLNTVY
jgi:hypothetical protein